MSVKKVSTPSYVEQPISVEHHTHSQFTGVVVALVIGCILLLAFFEVVMILSPTSWGDDAHMRLCVAQHLHNAAVCLVKTYHP